MIDKQYIPLFVFAICLALGLALAVFTSEWPTALAIALSGCALGLAMRKPEIEDHDTAFLEEDLAEIRTATERHDEDIAVLRTSIDEVAEIVESLATDIQAGTGGYDMSEIDTLRGTVDMMSRRVSAIDAPTRHTASRLDALEQSVSNLKQERLRSEEGAGSRHIQPVALAATGTSSRGASSVLPAAANTASNGSAGSITERAGRLRERFSRIRKPRKISASPIFDAARKPVSLLIDDPEKTASVEGGIAAIRHALSLIGASEDPESRIFVRFSADIATDPALADALERELEGADKPLARLVVLVPQSAIEKGPQRSLSLLLEAGARFGLERITDWSADMDALAKRGLVVIAVDGPAMAKSAMSQKGDPTRLRQVLHARGIQLLAGEIETRMQLDAVNSLLPDLIAGTGLGEATLLDAPE